MVAGDGFISCQVAQFHSIDWQKEIMKTNPAKQKITLIMTGLKSTKKNKHQRLDSFKNCRQFFC